MSIGAPSRPSRRSLLTAAAGGLAALVASAFGRDAPAALAGDFVQLGSDSNTTVHRTRIHNTNGSAFQAIAEEGGTGLDGRTDSGTATYGYSGSGIGVMGESAITGVYALGNGSGTALEAFSDAGRAFYVHTNGGICVDAQNSLNSSPAVRGLSVGGAGVHGYSGNTNPNDAPLHTGVYGAAVGSAASVGVKGESTSGRGGMFAGKLAQLRLTPSSAGSHPHSGSKGDFFVDASARLWFCKGGTNWTKLA